MDRLLFLKELEGWLSLTGNDEYLGPWWTLRLRPVTIVRVTEISVIVTVESIF
jgi:hypothetical protein